MVKRKVSKKELEKHLFNEFISNKPRESEIIEIIESETPDFFIHEKDKIISVEVTRLVHPALAEKEAFREKLVNRVHELFKLKYKISLYVLITFSRTPINCKANEIDSYAKKILEIIEPIYVNNAKYKFDICANDLEDINQFIESISVSNNRSLENWQSFGAFKVNAIDMQWLKKIISDKEKLIEKYQNNSDEKWLLLVSNFGYKSNTHDFFNLKLEKIESTFDKIYVFAFQEKEIICIK